MKKAAIPDSLLKQAAEVAEREGISLEQLISSALAEKLAAMMTVDYLRERAARGDRQRFKETLEKVPDVEPEPFDRI